MLVDRLDGLEVVLPIDGFSVVVIGVIFCVTFVGDVVAVLVIVGRLNVIVVDVVVLVIAAVVFVVAVVVFVVVVVVTIVVVVVAPVLVVFGAAVVLVFPFCRG